LEQQRGGRLSMLNNKNKHPSQEAPPSGCLQYADQPAFSLLGQEIQRSHPTWSW
jgi:hypothetical protein